MKKIKRLHHIMKEFDEFLNKIEKIDEISRIIPGRISRQQKWTSNKHITFSYFTDAGMKYNMKKGWTAQELFIICLNQNQEEVKSKIDMFLKL